MIRLVIGAWALLCVVVMGCEGEESGEPAGGGDAVSEVGGAGGGAAGGGGGSPAEDVGEADAAGPDIGELTGGPTGCEDTFAVIAGRFSGKAGVSPASGGIAVDWIEHDATYEFSVSADGVFTLHDTLQGDVVYDHAAEGATLTCTVVETGSLTVHSLLFAQPGQLSMNAGYGEELGTFSTFGGGFVDGTQKGAFLLLQIQRVE